MDKGEESTNSPAVLFSDGGNLEGNPSIPRGFVTYWRSYLGMGIVYFILMSISIVLQIVQVTSARSGNTLIPITAFWTAPFVYVVGALSISLSHYRNSYALLVGTMVMSILSAVIIGHISFTMWINEATHSGYHYAPVVPVIQIIFAIVLFVTMVVQASFTCYDCCWCCVASRNLGPTVVYTRPDQSQCMVTIVTSQPSSTGVFPESEPRNSLSAPLTFHELESPEGSFPYSTVTAQHPIHTK